MQQTGKYQLNLIERDDVFSPDPLNENMEKVEGALNAVQAEAAAGDAALGQRVTALEARKFVVGAAPSGSFVDLGVTPKAVVLTNYNGVMLLTPGKTTIFGQIMDNGLQTGSSGTFYYVAFL